MNTSGIGRRGEKGEDRQGESILHLMMEVVSFLVKIYAKKGRRATAEIVMGEKTGPVEIKQPLTAF